MAVEVDAGPTPVARLRLRLARSASTLGALVSASAKILLIDDASFANQFLQNLLAEANSSYHMDWRETWQAGLEALLTNQYELCLLDYQLGPLSGIDLLTAAVARGCRTPVVMLTGQGDKRLDAAALQAGAVDYLEKGSFTAESFDRIIRYNIERARTLERLRESEERYALASRGANDGIWDWKVGSADVYLSTRFKEIVGLADDELDGKLDAWLARVHPEDVSRFRFSLDALVSGALGHLEHEHRLKHFDGSWLHVLVRGQATRDADGVATRVAGSLTDVTRARSQDPLTGLPNRVLYRDRVERSLLRTRRAPGHHFAVLFIDLDRFKIINDSLGHSAGDELLVQIARRLEGCVRGNDTVARLGGDEFVMLLEDAREPDGAVRVANRVLEDLALPFKIEGREVFTGGSIGIAVSGPQYHRPEELLRDADTAMYRAKALGKGRAVVFDPGMHERALTVLTIESELRRAIDEKQLEVFYQPVIRLADRALVGFEGLVRWRHPVRGLVPPNDFIPIAEDTSLVVDIDRLVLDQALLQLARWRALAPARPLVISINASRRQFALPGCADFIGEALRKSGIAADALRLEVTESVAMDPSPTVAAQLQKVSELGVHLVVDDFGVGYSSLSLLSKYPFKGLKIDRSFVMQLEGSKEAQEIVRAMVSLGRALQLTVCAEGVETSGQAELVSQFGGQQGQGYLFGRPVPAEEATKLVLGG